MLSFLIKNTIFKPCVSVLVSPKCSFWPSVTRRSLEHIQKTCFSNATSSEVVIYSYESKNFFRMMSIFGVLQTVFWFNVTSLSFTPMNKSVTDASYVLDFQSKHRYKIAAGSCILGGVILFFSLAFPLRSISKITLLKSRNAADISTYSFFGRQRSFVTSLDNISCDRSRSSKGNYLSMKIKGSRMHYLLDKSNGVFHDPKTFDHVVGLKRIF